MTSIDRKFLSLFLIILLITGVFTGCASDSDTEAMPKTLKEIGVSVEEAYAEQVNEQFANSEFYGLRQMEYNRAPDEFPKLKVPCTEILLDIAGSDGITADCLNLFECYAFDKKDVKKNRKVWVSGEYYRLKDFEPYLLFETGDCFVYDLMLFASDLSIEAYYKERLDVPEYDALSSEWALEVRQWLLAQLTKTE